MPSGGAEFANVTPDESPRSLMFSFSLLVWHTCTACAARVNGQAWTSLLNSAPSRRQQKQKRREENSLGPPWRGAYQHRKNTGLFCFGLERATEVADPELSMCASFVRLFFRESRDMGAGCQGKWKRAGSSMFALLSFYHRYRSPETK